MYQDRHAGQTLVLAEVFAAQRAGRMRRPTRAQLPPWTVRLQEDDSVMTGREASERRERPTDPLMECELARIKLFERYRAHQRYRNLVEGKLSSLWEAARRALEAKNTYLDRPVPVEVAEKIRELKPAFIGVEYEELKEEVGTLQEPALDAYMNALAEAVKNQLRLAVDGEPV